MKNLKTVELRDYQTECVRVIDELQSGRVLVSMATGLGKTVVFSHLKRRGRVLIISHREELVRQPVEYFDCPCGIEQGEETSHGEPVVSASVQSLVRRLDKFKPDEFDMIITDEAHHAAAPTYKKIYSYFSPRVHVGFTATPNRGDKVRLDDVFDRIIFLRDLRWGIQNGYLTDVKCLRIRVSYDLRYVHRRMGDFVVNELEKAVDTAQANRQVAEAYKKYAKGQTLIFASSVKHAENIAELIDGAVVVSQSTKNRKDIIDRFTARKISCIVNCMIFTEGTDMPLIETVMIARPTQNASLYTQMVGRGLRQYKNKPYLTLIDLVGITEKNDTCTAPSLMGLDLQNIPEYRKDLLQGMLTDMDGIVEKAEDCAETWIMNVQEVNLFAKGEGVDVHRINWTKKSNGDLVYQLSCGDRIGVRAMDELGKTRVMRYAHDEKTDKFLFTQSDETSLQSALDEAYGILMNEYPDERRFWDLNYCANWQYENATEKQLAFIKSKLPQAEYEQLVSDRTLSKADAGQIINILNIRNLKPKDLFYMHRRSVEAKRQENERLEMMRKLKIRRVIIKKAHFKKFYAIKHPTDLVITNDWETAQDIIFALDGIDGEKCFYKGFFTIKEAEEYLRK